MIKKSIQSQQGMIKILPLLMVIAGVGIISFLLLSSTAPFPGGLFENLFPKPASHAAAMLR